MHAKKFRSKIKNYQIICALLIATSLLGTSYAYWTDTLDIGINITTGKIEVDVEQPGSAYEVGNGPCNSNGGQSPAGYQLTNTGTVPVEISLSEISGEDITIYKITGDKDDWREEEAPLQIDRNDLNQSASSCNKKCTVPTNMNLFDLLATKLVIQDGKTEGKKESVLGIGESLDISFDSNAHLEEVIGMLNPKGNGSTTGGVLVSINTIAKCNGWSKEIKLEIPIKHGNMKELDLGQMLEKVPMLPPPIEVPGPIQVPETKPEEPGPEAVPMPLPLIEVPETMPVPETKPEEPEQMPISPPGVPGPIQVPHETPQGPEQVPISSPTEIPGVVPDSGDIQEEVIAE